METEGYCFGLRFVPLLLAQSSYQCMQRPCWLSSCIKHHSIHWKERWGKKTAKQNGLEIWIYTRLWWYSQYRPQHHSGKASWLTMLWRTSKWDLAVSPHTSLGPRHATIPIHCRTSSSIVTVMFCLELKCFCNWGYQEMPGYPQPHAICVISLQVWWNGCSLIPKRPIPEVTES